MGLGNGVRVDVKSCLKIGMPEQRLRGLERFADFAEQGCMYVYGKSTQKITTCARR